MKLLRVQVPDFRVLKNVDISFEKDFVPNIFPLGSQNGGGKSTLLQLIFILLHCSGDSNKHEFIKNILYGFDIDENSQKRVLAIFDIWDGEKTVSLEFVVYRYSDANELLTSFEEFLISNDNIKNIESQIRNLEVPINSLIKQLGSMNNLQKIEQLQKLQQHQFQLQKKIEERERLECNVPKIFNFGESNRIVYIFNYSDYQNKNEEQVLLCYINNLKIDEAEDFLNQLSQKIFLAAPTTQVFLFLPQDTRKLLFQQQNNYQSEIQQTKSNLTGFFPYDFFAVNLLIDIFKSAGDKDFKQIIETGEYGNNYKQLVNDLNQILFNKKININPELSGFIFKSDISGQEIELFPEDLSHGELKRLSIYAWIKYNIIEDSIVLIDEIENGFHPDWQYQIINDIAEWSPNNQFIIATHSYELCQAVTPAHVKELEPRLIKQESES